ncbi:MAG: polyphosphate kinase 2, partial [Alcaligenaceae bacterium]|nr:polyphosphate kinase 2 [Alcaligenaceae bacterium]
MSQELSEHARRLYAEIMDSLDEELEMEIDDERYDAILLDAGY